MIKRVGKFLFGGIGTILTAVVFSVLYFHGHRIGELEGRLFPVVSQIELISFRPTPPPAYRTEWQARAEKLRACEFVRIEWFLGQRNAPRVGVVVAFLDAPFVWGTGGMIFDRLEIGLNPTETTDNSHGDVLHRCPMRPWLTRTPFYTSLLAETAE